MRGFRQGNEQKHPENGITINGHNKKEVRSTLPLEKNDRVAISGRNFTTSKLYDVE